MPEFKNANQKGDLFVRIQIQIPAELSDQEEELFKELMGQSQE